MCHGICNANWKCVDVIASNRGIKLQLGWTDEERRKTPRTPGSPVTPRTAKGDW
jgi:hypothetical protein